MHNLALELQRNGHNVSGSDDEIFEPSKGRLLKAGLLPKTMGWSKDNITPDLDLVILGMHARKDNIELVKAQKLALTIQSFPEFISQHSSNKKRIVVAGSHGKTTTTALVMHILGKRGLDFDYLVGSKLEGFELMVKLSDAPIIVIEGDEYLSSAIDLRPKFLWYRPEIAVVTGIAWDHINVFPTYNLYTHQFELFAQSMPNNASLIYYAEDEDLNAICSKTSHINTIPYGVPHNEIIDGTTFVFSEGQKYEMKVFGDHNLANMQSGVHVCHELGISTHEAWSALQSFSGTASRLEKLFDNGNALIYKDFAHSPSKVEATVSAVRKSYPDHRLVAILELHTFSSLNKDFLPLYANTMNPADRRIVHFNPHVFEMKKMEILEDNYVISQFGDVEVETDLKKLTEEVKAEHQGKVVFLFMSSGNWGGVGWLEELGLTTKSV
jgi:UDP-N-acetylmuramate: L-alanyl-gamma-D-glutamyl-meso-diaminopimelate ligase